MALDPKRVYWSKCELIQRDLVADLPPLNGSSSPKAGTFCWVSQGGGQLWLSVSDPNDPVNLNAWEFIGPSGAGAMLPDIRFIVARTGYGGGTLGDLVPNTTYTDPDPAVAFNNALAAAAAYRVILQAFPEFGAQQAKVTVHLHPDLYNDTFDIPEGVTIHGLGANPSDTLVNRMNFASPGGVDCGARNLMLIGDDANVAIASTNGGIPFTLHFEDVEVMTGKTVALAHFGTTIANRCVFDAFSWTAPISSFLQSLRTQYLSITTSAVSYRSVEDRVTGPLGGTPDVSLTGGNSVMRDILIGTAGTNKNISVYLSGAAILTLYRANFVAQTNPGGSLVDANPDSQPCTLNVRAVNVLGGNNALYGPASRLTVNAMSSHEPYTIEEVPGVVDEDGFVTATYDGTPDIIEITPEYGQFPPSPTVFLLVPTVDASRLAPGRKVTYKNRSFPGELTAGPFALVTNGQPIDNLASSAAPATVTSATHVIVPPGSQVTLYVRNDRASFGVCGN